MGRIGMAAAVWAVVALAQTQVQSAYAVVTAFRVGIIGDFGVNNTNEGAVAQLVHALGVSDIITAGDNNYIAGAPETIDANVGRFYQSFIWPYHGAYGPGAADGSNHFWPTLGNHDWFWQNGNPQNGTTRYYQQYFTSLPGNQRYYRWSLGPDAGGPGVAAADFFAVSSTALEPDGITANSTQALWLRDALNASCAVFRFVYFHHPPYSSGTDPTPALRWPFALWGADAVITGHDHVYDRIIPPAALTGGRAIPYFVNGVGGAMLTPLAPAPAEGSQFRYNTGFGAQLLELSVDPAAPFGSHTFARFSFFGAGDSQNALDAQTIGVSPAALPRPAWCPAASGGGGGGDDGGGGGGLRPGVIAVIVLAVLFAVGTAIGLFWFRRKQQRLRYGTDHHELHDRDAAAAQL